MARRAQTTKAPPAAPPVWERHKYPEAVSVLRARLSRELRDRIIVAVAGASIVLSLSQLAASARIIAKGPDDAA